MLNKWEQRFYDLAKVAASWSKDPKCGVGACIVHPDRTILSLGYNGFPKGIKDDHRLHDRCKNDIMIHAEVNAIMNAHRDVSGWILFVTKAPCLACALLIIQSKVKKVYFPIPDPDSNWYEDNMLAKLYLKEAGIEVETL